MSSNKTSNFARAAKAAGIAPRDALGKLDAIMMGVFEIHGAIRAAWNTAKKGTFEEKVAHAVVGTFVAVVVWVIAAIVDLNTTYVTVTAALGNYDLVPSVLHPFSRAIAIICVVMPQSVELLGSRLARDNVAKIRPVLYAVVAFDALTDVGLAMTSAAYALKMACGNDVAATGWVCYRFAMDPYLLIAVYVVAAMLLLVVYSFYLEAVGIVVVTFTISSIYQAIRQYPLWRQVRADPEYGYDQTRRR